jgi:hypothetical protein
MICSKCHNETSNIVDIIFYKNGRPFERINMNLCNECLEKVIEATNKLVTKS